MVKVYLETEADILRLVEEDKWMMDILRTAAELKLPDWWICAGFVRSKIWDTLHSYPERTPMPDVDVVYFDPANLDETREKELEQRLYHRNPDIPWSVKNEARMHVLNHMPPFRSTVDAISKFPETATALGLRLDSSGQVELAAPWGLTDVLQLVVKPSPLYLEDPELLEVYRKRVKKKNWTTLWPGLIVEGL